MLSESKTSKIFNKIRLIIVKFERIFLLEFLSFWLLKKIIGKKDEMEILRLKALHYPTSRLIFAPAMGFFVMFVILTIFVYFSVFSNDLISFVLIGILFWGGAAIISAPVGYIVSPVVFSIEGFFLENGPQITVIEYRFLIKILTASIPILLVTSFFSYYLTVNNFQEFKGSEFILLKSAFILCAATSIMISAAVMIKIGQLVFRKEFRFYLAKYSFEISSEIDNEYKKFQFAIFGLDSYNKFLKRMFKLNFKNITYVFEKIISHSSENMNKIIKEIYDKMDPTNIELIRFLIRESKPEENENGFLTKSTLKDKFLEFGPIIAGLTSMGVLFISFIQSLPSIWNAIKTILQIS